MRILYAARVLCLSFLLAPIPASAQPVFVGFADLRVVDATGDHEVGWLRGGPALITGWSRPDEVELHFEDETISLDAQVALGGDTELLATPAQVVTLESGGAFRVEMLPGTFGRVVRRDDAGRLRIRLPRTLPARVAAMPVGSPVASATAPETRYPPDDDTWVSICRPTRVLSRPSPSATVWMVDGPSTRAEAGPPSHGYRPVRIWIDGYIVHGFLERALRTDLGCGGGTFATSCRGAFRITRTRITLPPGTALFGSALGPDRFATLLAPQLAAMVEPGDIPDAPTAWRIERDEERGARWSLEVWLRDSPDALRSYPHLPSEPEPSLP